jgi:hypothetical protein
MHQLVTSIPSNTIPSLVRRQENLILYSARSELSQGSLFQQSGPALISTIISAVKGVLEL